MSKIKDTPQNEGKNQSFSIPILNDEYKVIVVISTNEEFIKRVMYDWQFNIPKELELDKRRGTCFYNPNCHPLIVVPAVKTPQQIGTLAHEAVHAIDNIFDKIEESLSQEVFAHSVGAIVRITLEKINLD